MPGTKYEQLSLKGDTEDVVTSKPKGKWSDICVQKSLLSLGLILIYFSLSIGLTFYQRWLLKGFNFPLTVVMYHLIIKWILSVLVRTILYLITGTPQLVLPFMTCLRSVGPTGLASGIDVGFSNWGLELVTISLYTMTKSTTIIFILLFAILLGLEKKSWSLVGIVLLIAVGLVMFTYKATQFDLLGFNFLLLASFAAGLRWTFAQLLMQRSSLGLHNPIDMVFHVQPWIIFCKSPSSHCIQIFNQCHNNKKTKKNPISQVVIYKDRPMTDDLTTSDSSEEAEEMFILVLAVEVSGDQLSAVNVAGLALCLLGIVSHIVHKVYAPHYTKQPHLSAVNVAGLALCLLGIVLHIVQKVYTQYYTKQRQLSTVNVDGLALCLLGIVSHIVHNVYAPHYTKQRQLSAVNVAGLALCLLGIVSHIVHKVYAPHYTTAHYTKQHQLSTVNVAGLALCLLGIVSHIVHNVLVIRAVAGSMRALDSSELAPASKRSGALSTAHEEGEHSRPLLDTQPSRAWTPTPTQSDDSDLDHAQVIYQVLQRRDNR
ncbi:unnamed protein product [Chilo suppressalis]|uniref:Sugar phosphate transporter domain-containing protein n=1 Tax=Chilo suppressalis TaxID=168631 RepID=A0ABN8AZ77_CHISP|nr:unnamed protein product [Chilo suppressalis]